MIELKNIVYAVTGSAVLQVVGMHVLHVSMPRSYPVLYLLLLFFLTGFSRFIWRILPERTQETEQKPDTIRTMIVGAGEAGNMLLKELVGSSHLNRKIEINDLLGREPVDLRMETIMRYVKDIEIGDTTYTKQENGSFTAPSTAAAVGQTATALPASSISVSGSVNRKKPGPYELTYTMQDKNGRHFYSNMAF